MPCAKKKSTKGKKPKKKKLTTKKVTKKRKKKSSGRVEAYTYGEAQRSKDWPFGSGSMGR